VLQEAGAVREREELGWMQDRADPHAHERALVIAREDPQRCLFGRGGGCDQKWAIRNFMLKHRVGPAEGKSSVDVVASPAGVFG
jgi:hypothetical protein